MDPYYEKDGITIYHGDCMEVLRGLPGADCVLLDPPYSMVPNSFNGEDDGAAGTSGAPIMLLSEVLRQTRRLLPDGGSAGILTDWRRQPDVAYLAAREGLRITTCVAWVRPTAGLGGMFRSAWDPLLVLSKGKPRTRDNTAVRNVCEAAKPRGKAHPYEKPAKLWTHLLSRIPKGSRVVDPFMGTGSSMVSALCCGHTAIGIEIEERYCEIAAKRLAQGVLNFTEKP